MLADLILDSQRQGGCQTADVSLFIARCFGYQWWSDDQQVFFLFFAPRCKDRHQRSVCAQREFRYDKVGCSRNGKKIDEDGLVIESIEVRQKANVPIAGAQNLEHQTAGYKFVEGCIAESGAVAIDELLDSWIVDSPNRNGHRVAQKGEREAGQLPGTQVSSQQNYSIAVGFFGGVEVFEAAWLNHIAQLFLRTLAKLAEQSQQPAETGETFADQNVTFFVSFLRKCQL